MNTISKIILTLLCLAIFTSFGQKADAFYREGLEKSKSGKFEEAIKLFNKSIELQPDDYYSWYNRGLAKTMVDQYDDALIDFNKTIELASDFKRAYFSRGITRRILTDYEGAMKDFNMAIEYDADYAEAYYYKGLLNELLLNREDACKDFDKANELGMKNAKRKVDKCNDTTKSAIPINTILRLTTKSPDKTYGFTQNNPVKVGTGPEGGPANQRLYLDLLRDAQGKPIRYKRIQSCCAHNSEYGFMGTALLDEYEISYFDSKNKLRVATVFMSFYDYDEPQILDGFKTVGQR